MSSVPSGDPLVSVMPPPPRDLLYEVINGRYVELPPMGTLAASIASRLSAEVGAVAEAARLGEVVAHCLFGLTTDLRQQHRPDVAFVSYKRWPKDKPCPTTDPWPVVPELAVEVISPNDLAESVQAKVKEYLEAGVQLVWLIYPQLGWIVAYESLHRMRGFTMTDELDAEPVLPGFRLPLRELFSAPAAPQADGDSGSNPEPTA